MSKIILVTGGAKGHKKCLQKSYAVELFLSIHNFSAKLLFPDLAPPVTNIILLIIFLLSHIYFIKCSHILICIIRCFYYIKC